MGKRSDFERKQLDFYRTPRAALQPLLRHLPLGATFCEPCAGDGALIAHLNDAGYECVSAMDVFPRAEGIATGDASFLSVFDIKGADLIITNPPWDRPVLHQIIERSAALAPTWLLFDADWMHTRQAVPHMEICRKIVSVGRVQWIEGSGGAGKDNCCWYLFDVHGGFTGNPVFVGRSR